LFSSRRRHTWFSRDWSSDVCSSDLLKNNFSSESLLAWHWVVSNTWTSQNTLQSDLALQGFSEFGDTWGDWNGPSVDLQQAFGENALLTDRNNADLRRKATMMMYGDE